MQNVDLAKPIKLQFSKLAKHAKAHVSHAILKHNYTKHNIK